jgi:DNA-binding MarR family transcriptional regulator
VKPDILQVFRNWIDRLVKGFSPREREDLVELLTRMIGNLDDTRREMN